MFNTIKHTFETACLATRTHQKQILAAPVILTAVIGLINIGFAALDVVKAAKRMSKNNHTWGALPSLITALESVECVKQMSNFLLTASTAAASVCCLAYRPASRLLLRAYNRGSELREKVDLIESEGSPDWQEKAIKTIRQSRENLPILEEDRLRGASVLTVEMKAKIDAATKRAETRMMIAQAFEIQKVFKSTHYVFIHAQRQAYYPIATIYKQLAKTDAKDSSHFKFIRKNETTDPKRTIKDFNSGSMVKDTDPAVSKDLISCTANFLDNSYAESALFFLQLNLNVLDQNNSDAVAIRNTGMLSYTESDKIAAKIPPSPTGNLLVFCIPKNKIDEIAYRAHPLGTACKCFTPDQQKVILDRWQQGISNKEDSCSDKTGTQYRIFLPAFRKESGCRLYYLTPHAKPIRTKIKQAAKEALIRSKL